MTCLLLYRQEKSTLIKVLCRLYDPTEGEVLLDGRDLRTYDIDDLRKNIGFGQIEMLHDDARILEAATLAGADDLLPELSDGLETIIGYKRNLSGGQWQKVALARVFLRRCQILILDEPTAALDALKQYNITRRFEVLAHEKTTLLVSHHFGTIRLANHILVLNHGELTEEGTHEELLKLGKLYAEMFTKQAEGYL
jgi:ATP-binding cassette subfamily B protein